MKKTRVSCIALAAALLACSSAWGNIVVSWDPAVRTIPAVGQEGSLSIYADIPSADAIIGWGLDLYFDEAVATVSDIVYGPLWSEVGHAPTAQDLIDGVDFDMAAISLYPPPDGVSGHVLLATLTFQAIGLGQTQLLLGAHTPLDLNEGLAKNPPPTGQFVPFTVELGTIIVPEPATLALLGVAAVGMLRRR